MKDLKELKEKIVASQKIYLQSKGYSDVNSPECKNFIESDQFYNYVNNIYNYIDNTVEYIYEWIHEHQEGHLPKINGADRMTKALDVLGISGDYIVEKPIIWAKNGNSITATVEYIKKV